MFKQYHLLLLVLIPFFVSCSKVSDNIRKINSPEVALTPITYLASDSLKGRDYARPEINIAASYINKEFESLGLKKNEHNTDYYQTFTIGEIQAKNIIGWVEGSDEKLKDQFIVLTAHYDHLGVTKGSQYEVGNLDSIYNGARDNAIGVAGLIDAARYFVKYPPKRSVLFIAYTAEEPGFIGSQYFAEHPVFPLKQLVFNLNIDNVGYNDTTIITLIGSGKTTADEDIKKACASFNLSVLPDPAPEKNLFERSDNISLADKGVPALTFCMGFRSIDNEIQKHYHNVSDEVSSLNLSYVVKYIDSFILTAQYIADDPKQPVWTNSGM